LRRGRPVSLLSKVAGLLLRDSTSEGTLLRTFKARAPQDPR